MSSTTDTNIGRYFLLRWEVQPGYCAVFHIPREMPFIHKPATGQRMGAEYQPGVQFKMTDKEKGLRIADVVPNACGYFMVSARMKTLLEQHAQAEIEFLRFTLLNHKGKVASDDLYIANVIGMFDCVDMNQSVGTPHPMRPGRFMYVRRLALDEARIPPDRRLFRTKVVPTVLIIRDDLKEIFEREQVTGPTYPPVGSDVNFTP
ncbi:MAG TPA: DUF1629 domain-containing protein [Myxococcaceae bacterium]|nr:DUF1629 domain-containing protein [Myxococcaceae bacterium]